MIGRHSLEVFARRQRWFVVAMISFAAAWVGVIGFFVHERDQRSEADRALIARNAELACANVNLSRAIHAYYLAITPTIDDLGVREPVDLLITRARRYNDSLDGACLGGMR